MTISTQKTPLSVLLVSGPGLSVDRVAQILGPSQYTPVHLCLSATEARRLLLTWTPDLLLINAPLPDENGIQLAQDLAQRYPCGILLLVKAGVYEQASYCVEDSGVLTLPKPVSRQALYQAVKLLSATRWKLKALENQAATLQSKMEEIQVINRAKFLLVERQNMTESEAHRYLEKKAMDTCQKRRVVAQAVIAAYEGKDKEKGL